MTSYSEKRKISEVPRIPLEGNIDLTYHCNNDCLHCWLRIPPVSKKPARVSSSRSFR